ncbi:type IV pilus modification protein PilV [Ottowia sp.]|uniref:type IV pilus modification protein PilV n=1 Tax=Ottowia sp. TaxID=1898956 RepID=UPI002C3A0B0A|nr:type IV pilus modification protein PilV [Ottowia sp.]HOB66820.1 type IV pilus modification protein PilV [Ottowia sp.]HPZ55825.1 type IV pilus modification protein PilV [Ottowia sp.]HQD48017.1 type IV pilus modification protein PilV [Ottowia sp.]
MHRLTPLRPAPPRQQRGITLIESLIAIVVAALGILGILGVQMRTLTDTQTSVRRAQAVRLIEDLGERMKVNPNALAILGSYTSSWTASPPTPAAAKDCSATACNGAELATYDVAEWKRGVQRVLPLGDATIFLAPGETVASNRRQLGVMISWRENERDTSAAYKNNVDATKVIDSTGTVTEGGATVTCPADRTCHLQYLPVAGRCAPYTASGASQYFCAGA